MCKGDCTWRHAFANLQTHIWYVLELCPGERYLLRKYGRRDHVVQIYIATPKSTKDNNDRMTVGIVRKSSAVFAMHVAEIAAESAEVCRMLLGHYTLSDNHILTCHRQVSALAIHAFEKACKSFYRAKYRRGCGLRRWRITSGLSSNILY